MLIFRLFIQPVQSQRCIVVRNISGFGQYNLTDNAFCTSDWQLNINNRYFKSFPDFKGTADQKTPEHRNDSTKVLSAVNPSIQLGDGGTGIITELNLFYVLNAARTISFYGNLFITWQIQENKMELQLQTAGCLRE